MIKPKPKSRRNRAAVTNGSTLFLGDADGRSDVARRFADILADLLAERGGEEGLSVAQREACRTYAGLVVSRDLMHAQLARGVAVDPEAMGQIGDRMARQVRLMGPVKAPERKTLEQRLAERGGKA